MLVYLETGEYEQCPVPFMSCKITFGIHHPSVFLSGISVSASHVFPPQKFSPLPGMLEKFNHWIELNKMPKISQGRKIRTYTQLVDFSTQHGVQDHISAEFSMVFCLAKSY
jgi:hypothetical protein